MPSKVESVIRTPLHLIVNIFLVAAKNIDSEISHYLRSVDCERCSLVHKLCAILKLIFIFANTMIAEHISLLKPLNISSESGIRITYAYVIPVLSSAGIFGNMLSLVILNSNKNFRGFMYTYMKGLAVTDTLYLISVLQVTQTFQINKYIFYCCHPLGWILSVLNLYHMNIPNHSEHKAIITNINRAVTY